MTGALLLIDYEEEWRTQGSDAYLGDLTAPIANARRLLEAARRFGLRVIFTRHEEPAGSPIFRPGGPGAMIVPELAPGPGEPVLVKNKISPFFGTSLDAEIARGGIDHLTIGGIMTNLCVRSAVADAYDRSLGITLVTDACASDSASTDQFTFDDLHKTRPEIRIADTEAVLRGMAAR